MTTVETISHDVFLRSPGSSTWRLAEHVRCLSIESVLGPPCGNARFAVISETGEPLELVELYRLVKPDDEVQVRVDPIDLPEIGPVLRQRSVAFEGVVHLRSPVVQSASGDEDAGASFTAWPSCVEMNLTDGHVITGRWIAAPNQTANANVAVLETKDLPAVFNFGGAANRHAAATITAGELTAPVFTHDDAAPGSDGQLWTVREALAALLTQWLLAPAPGSSDLSIEAETLAALNTEDPSGASGGGARWDGWNDVLPETNVHGLGVLDALDAVCRAAGFEFGCVPTYADPGSGDARYELKIWRRDAGPGVTLKLNRRGRDTTAKQALRNNTHSRVALVADAGRCRPIARAVGASLIECTVELRPLWDPDDAATPDLDGSLQAPGTSAYHQKHVAGGTQFADFFQVGRLWGVDCTGRADGYTSGPYAHPGGDGGNGFDWVTELGLNAPGSGLTTDRSEHGVNDAVAWSSRLRPLLPLQRPETVKRGLPYVMAVSEDGGNSWTGVPLLVRSAAPLCGLQLLQLPNLATVNLATLGTADVPPVEESWWALMFPASGGGDAQLRFRVTACVPADHAAVAVAPRRSNAGVQRDRVMMHESPVEEVWAAPASQLNQTGDWELLAGNVPDASGGGSLQQVYPVLAQAQRMRDAHDGLRLAGAAYSWIMDLGRHAVGDRVTRIEGQDLSMQTSRTDTERAPTVASVSVRLWPEEQQGVAIDMRDREVSTRARRGREAV
ncbi:MAG: hypothetical protein AAGF84_03755 [Planctomycetota bacterium]